MLRVAVCAPSTPFDRDDAVRVAALAQDHPGVEIVFHDQCFAQEGHFAGPDALRLAAFVECASDPGFDAVWFARGGYGAGRIAQDALGLLGPAARGKAYLGYSDGGVMLAALYRAGIGRPVHAPMPVDVRREGGEAAVRRTLAWLGGEVCGLEPSLDGAVPAVAFNLMTLAMIMGTPVMPDLAGHVVMVEEVSEYDYAVDRLLFHVTAGLAAGKAAGLRLGRVTQVPENDRPFGISVEEMARHWCARAGLPYLGRAQIGHDADNRIVPFGLAGTPQGQ
ncbi:MULTISPECIES: LD-carboxypeptidase [unclassified Novosphingobium]|uniref:LD-carboxypeptidase n=1 Tax=unclassified Novosphingobium TaxID=2644732 RepID=UPI00146D0188|nr:MULTISPECIES: LD-carboxypeptidase [unclassified Novosphingobium]NMN06654.1 muramoyltetrapeptide carboxypeptidase [Novosphingobium sp. SG919]NMN88895.1 muramoyltetrapeptide carboxypeptidase [Novosphingobium sp. SG916]